MLLTERMPRIRGTWEMLAYRGGALVEMRRGGNTICRPLYRMWRGVLAGQAPPASHGVQYLAVGGGGSTAPTSDDQRLTGYPAEFKRWAPQGAPVRGVGALSYQFQLAEADAVGTWTDLGLWGNGASSTTNNLAGALLTHSLISYVKDSVTALVINYQFEMG